MTEYEKKSENSFRNILKGTSLFGGVQVFNILIAAIRLKFVAVILGPAGMGIAGLFNTASLTIQQLSSLGLNLAIVKEIGHNKNDRQKMADILGAIRPLIIISAMAGALVCLIYPGIFSSMTFGSKDFTGSFRLLSAAVFFSIVGSALMSVLQGLHAVKPLSKASVVGSMVGLVVGVPLYWLLGTNGIVPAMVALAVSTCLWYGLSLRKVMEVRPTSFNRQTHLPLLKQILTMGIILMSNDLMRSLANYLLLIFVRGQGGEIEVGFFQSCSTMTAQYSAIVFTAMAMDYLPRLSAAEDNESMCVVVNRQMEVVGLLITPIASSVILLAPWIIEILQSEMFIAAVPLLRLLAAAVVLQALMYPLGYIVFAKDNRRLFFWMESVGANLLTLFLSCGGYFLFGLKGLGYAAIADCSVCLCVYIAVNSRLYGYHMSGSATAITLFSLTATAVMTVLCFLLEGILLWACTLPLLTAVGYFSSKELWRRIRK